MRCVVLTGILLAFAHITLAADGPLPGTGGDGTLRRIHVPILMYHYVSPLPADADDIRIGLTVAPDVFRAQMERLRAEGYETVSLYDLNAALLWGAPLPPQPVILTFDDGYSEHYTTVFPVLRELGFTATFFVITGRQDAGDPAYMTWAQIKEMAAAGMSMEPHTKSHRDLRDRDHDFLVYEMLGSRESLEAHNSGAARMFSYPAGRYDALTLQTGAELGFWRAVTTQPGTLHTTDNRLELPRVRVNPDTGVIGLLRLVRGP
jgi:peptidoglycan/xylan/chitin deacetylase (PgdA/CDA1 family)